MMSFHIIFLSFFRDVNCTQLDVAVWWSSSNIWPLTSDWLWHILSTTCVGTTEVRRSIVSISSHNTIYMEEYTLDYTRVICLWNQPEVMLVAILTTVSSNFWKQQKWRCLWWRVCHMQMDFSVSVPCLCHVEEVQLWIVVVNTVNEHPFNPHPTTPPTSPLLSSHPSIHVRERNISGHLAMYCVHWKAINQLDSYDIFMIYDI